MAALARERGTDFQVTSEAEAELRRAGATDDLVSTFRELAPKPPEPAPAPAAPPALVVEATPGGARVYIDDEPVGTTGQEGVFKLSTLSAGQHRVRLSLAGYRDYEQGVELAAGQTAKVSARLEAVETPASPSPPSVTSPTSVTSPGAGSSVNQSVARFRVRHWHHSGLCVGWMEVGGGMVRYRSEDGAHSFGFPLSAMKSASKDKLGRSFVAKSFTIRMEKGVEPSRAAFGALDESGRQTHADAILAAISRGMGTR